MIEIKEKKECSGCMACYNICPKKCINMIEDIEGFLYPKVNKDECIKCGLCKKVCPYYKNNVKKTEGYPIVLAGWNKNEKERITSSSGGIFIEIAKMVINKGGTICAAGYSEDKRKITHKIVDDEQKLEELKGSKYVQSYIGDIYSKIKNILETGKVLLFVGTPCQVYGLKNYLGKEYKNLVTVDLICHGVPSPKIYREYIKWLEEKFGLQVDKVEFRNKDIGWEEFQMKVSFKKSNFIYYGKQQEDLFLKGFLKHLYIRPACHECKYAKLPRNSDITLADFWKIEKQNVTLNNKNLGTSAIVINTEKGNKIIEELRNKLYLEKSDIEFLKQYNKGIYKSSTEPNRFRRLFFFDFNKKKGLSYLNKEYIQNHSKIKKLFQQLRLKMIKEKL